MPNLFVISENDLFKQDLLFQIKHNCLELIPVSEEGDIVDIVIIDENVEKVSHYVNKYPHTPVFVLLKKGMEKPQDKKLITYIQKPLSLCHFLNQLSSAINLAVNSEKGKLLFNKYELNPARKEILNLRNKEVVRLTEKEVSILQYLYKIRDRIVSKSELLQEVWGYNPDVTTHTIETHIYRLRQKVEQEDKNAQLIITEEGGYFLKK